MREFLARLADWFRRDKLQSELNEEIAFHRAQLERDATQAGLAPTDARHAAARQLGNLTQMNEHARERWSLPRLDHVQQDVRYALRGLRRSPGFTATVIVTLALGIGANAAMFGVIDRLMFRPFPHLADPGAVHRVYLHASFRGEPSWDWGGEYTRYLDLKRFTTAFSHHAAFTENTLAIGTGDASRERTVGTVSASFFDFFDAPPALGRYFTAAEDTTPRGAEVAVLGYEFWQTEFGARDVRGEVLRVGHITTTIIGVVPKGFQGVSTDEPPAVYIPVTLFAGSSPNITDASTYYTRYNWGWLNFMVRRRPGVTADQASADLTHAWRRSWAAEREIHPGGETVELANPVAVASAMKPAAGPNRGLEARTALWLTGVAAVVFIIACANVANLFLVRAMRRQRETAVRLALGVSRARLLMQTLIESVILAGIGAIAALGVAQWGGAAIRRMLVGSPGASFDTLTDWRTLGVVACAALVAGVFTGTLPALLSRRGDLTQALKAGAREGTYQRSRARAVLLVAQSALAVVLLVGASLFVRSLANVNTMRLGYDADRTLLVTRSMRGVVLDSAQRVALRRSLMDRAREIPGVERVAWMSSVPLWSSESINLHVAGIDSVRRLGRFTFLLTTPGYFEAMGTRILRGRGFTEADSESALRVAVVSDAMARALWPDKDALGQCLGVGSPECRTVVGVAEDIVQNEDQLTDEKRFHYYLPVDQYAPASGTFVMLRVRGNVAAQAEGVRTALQSVMPGQSYVSVQPFSNAVNGARRSWQLGATLFVAFGVLALVVAAVGLHGVIAYNVAQRMHELGVRVALGAQRPDILGLVVGQSARFTLAGIIAGSALALFASRWLQPLLFRQSAKDPLVFALVAGMMLLVALIAAASPALRAARADPNRALRSE